MENNKIKKADGGFIRILRRFLIDSTAAIAISFIMSLPVLIAAAGISVDLAQAYNVRNRLANALDKAALAAGSTSGTQAQIEDRVNKFLNANYKHGRIGDLLNVSVVLDNNLVTVKASARAQSQFMALFGKDYMNVNAESVVRREMAGVEVVLVLDVTGSMAGSNITALKKAALNFIDIMFKRVSDKKYLRIAIVPFSQSVNVGPYGLGKDLSGNNYGTAFVSRPSSDDYTSPASNIKYGTSTNDWKGCILERSSPKDTNDDSTTNWGMYRYPKVCSKKNNQGVCTSYSNNNPNTSCTASQIVPLTNVRADLDASINALTAAGGTYINVGTVWGWHVISPGAPFTEGTAYDDPDWTKTIIVMTDGNNEPSSAYSAYGANSNLTAGQLNTKFATICQNIKNEGITLYTVTFQSGITNATRDIFRTCASENAKYYNAPSDNDLSSAFTQIANQLSQLHIVK